MVSRFFHTEVRHAHVISTFGPGALQITRNGVCAITCGLPIWMKSLEKAERLTTSTVLHSLTIRDSHMEQPLGVNRLIAPWSAADSPYPESDWIIPAARFPLYEYCQNPSCQHLYRRDPSEYNKLTCSYTSPMVQCTTGRHRRWPTIQVPVVLACPNGHLSDISWADWLHEIDGPDCPYPDDIRYRPGGTPKQPTIECRSCKRRRSFDPDMELPCNGARPWLPGFPHEECNESMRVVERSSKTIYYAHTVSSLAIPPAGVDNPELVKALHEVSELRTLRALFVKEHSSVTLNEIIRECKLQGIDTNPEDVRRHIDALQQSRDAAEDRPQELATLRKPRPKPLTGRGLPDLIVECADMTGYRKQSPMKLFSEISLVHRLRVVQVLTGFSRIQHTPGSPPVKYEQLWGRPKPDKLSEDVTDGWLPAYQVYGEGILFVFDKDAVSNWMSIIASAVQQRPLCADNDPSFVLAHTMAHLIMRAIAPYAGYPLPSIRERIYSEDDLAFLIYTSAGDIRGTLGGLVELGHPGQLEDLLDEATEHARWCTTDPVCIDDGIELGLYDTTSPGACHHCLLLPETSCEFANRRLDRAAVVGTSQDDRLGILTSLG